MNDRSQSESSSRPQDDWDAQDSRIQDALLGVSPPPGARERARMRLRAAIDAAEVNAAEPVSSESLDPARDRTLAKSAMLPRFSRRRLLGLATAAAASGLAIGYWQTRPVSREQLASVCIDALNQIMETPPQWESGEETDFAGVTPLLNMLRRTPTRIGVAKVAPNSLAKRSVVWKFGLANGKSLYVFQWQANRQVDNLGERLQVIQQASGGWSLAAMQSSEQILVAAVAGEIAPYFQSVPLA